MTTDVVISDADAQEEISITNPITGEVIGAVKQFSRQDMQDAVKKARSAQIEWGAMSVKARCRIIRRWGDSLWDNHKQVMEIIRKETGKNDTGAFLEIIGVDNTVGYYTSRGPRILRSKKRRPLFPVVQKARVHYKPHGVAGFITPWNYPFALAMMDVIPALIAGNTAIIKPSEITPFSAFKAIDLLYEAGLPENVIQIVTGDGKTGAALVDYADYINFTGSTAVGRKVAVVAAERLIPYCLELGGKDSAIILKDANIELAASSMFIGGCENAGQMCLSIERVYVEEAIYDHFIDRVLHFAGQLKISAEGGFDVHIGSLTNERELLRVEEHIQDALDKGAKSVFGGRRLPEIGPLFFEPAVLVDVDHSMKVMTEETFGPIIPIMKVADEKEAIKWANDSEYGLSGLIFTKNGKYGANLATQLDTGDISVNRAGAVVGSLDLPWGGQKASGVGRRGGPEGLLRFTTTQSIVIDSQIAMKPSLTLIDPFVLRMLKLMRRVRRIFPFL
jgi:succinate-semialdehyde dehydrogenase / glutarate-semialdehyde dehydrogenase